ncbi:MAG: MBL fold metallo-hydrolase [Desulfobacteraceae bacterium]|nr:MAG: MBL fold metallo-hydrolase [Desulfobacteraceae bacterium]
MELVFLGTGAAWGIPELTCGCRICEEMRKRNEKRDRTAIILKGEKNVLIDCGPDIRNQLSRNNIGRVDAVFITHEHGDHFIGLDELFSFKRNVPRDAFSPIPVYLSRQSWDVIKLRFGYLEEMGVIAARCIDAGTWFKAAGLEAMAFKTDHGKSAAGSVGFLIRFPGSNGKSARLVYTSDFIDIPEIPEEALSPEIMITQSVWLNEPVKNRPCHMSLQRVLHFIEIFSPQFTYLTHIGDADMVPGDPYNESLKKYIPKDPFGSPSGGGPYPIPLCQSQWEETLKRVLHDHKMPFKVAIAYDDLRIEL